MSALKLAVSMLDVTTLEGADSVGKVRQMCQKAMRPLPQDPSVGPAAAAPSLGVPQQRSAEAQRLRRPMGKPLSAGGLHSSATTAAVVAG